ncbi:MAG: hypothetical protein HXX08_05120 [Chloroflexi bacterium]|uniref:Peptidase MA-like domain-containing protein n=1 Tax=Candidatus Chlorohelix allophototropha TaxID=3003348 RepID=A0A8T7LWB8_9CHLR|nr:hypothetical protein [Chloroflexota bacterium]WJW67119.1 hypothetical protein OZ401_000373 [Chloroflexota bacterium L227-S17]
MKTMRFVIYLLAAMAGLLFFIPIQAQADSQVFPTEINITLNRATPNFPDNVSFEFNATNNSLLHFSKIELNYKLQGEVAIKSRSQNLNPDTSLISASYILDTQKEFIPPGVHIRYYWTLYTQANDRYDSPAQEFIVNDERFPFKELSSGFITIRWYEGSDAFGQAILNKVKATANKLSSQYGIKANSSINIHVYPDQRTLYTALPPNSEEFVGGQAYVKYGAISLLIPPGDDKEIGRSVPHEISHLIVYQATSNPYNGIPLWLDEGLAVYNQDEVEGFLIESFQRGVDKRTLQPLRTISGRFPNDPVLFYQSYGESVNVVKYIVEKYGEAKLGQLLVAFKNGVSYDEALVSVLGITTDELDRQWKLSLGYPVSDVVAIAATPTPTIAQPSPLPLTTVAAVVLPTSSNIGNPTVGFLPDIPKGSPTSNSSISVISANPETNNALLIVLASTGITAALITITLSVVLVIRRKQ